MFDHPDFDDHEQMTFACDPAAGLRAIIALHSTALGPAFGGCRMWPYRSEADALTDALRLARGMTYKAAICDLPYGGGKSVIIGDPKRAKTPALLRAMGRAVEALGGRYIVADDIGTTLDDLVRDARGHQPHRGRDGGGAGAARGHRLWRADGDPGGRAPGDRPRPAGRPPGRDPGARQRRPAARRLSAAGGRRG